MSTCMFMSVSRLVPSDKGAFCGELDLIYDCITLTFALWIHPPLHLESSRFSCQTVMCIGHFKNNVLVSKPNRFKAKETKNKPF